jgi:PRTRC genetic system protein E
MKDWKEQVKSFDNPTTEKASEGFFTKIAELLNDSTSVSMTIKKLDDKLTVSLLPKSTSKDEALSKISPIIMSGSPSEFDTAFFANITASVSKFTEFSTESITFEKSVEEAKEKSAMAKAKKEEAKKEKEAAKKKAEANKEKINELIKESEIAISEKNTAGLRDIINSITKLDPSSKYIKELEQDLNNINPSLF